MCTCAEVLPLVRDLKGYITESMKNYTQSVMTDLFDVFKNRMASELADIHTAVLASTVSH